MEEYFGFFYKIFLPKYQNINRKKEANRKDLQECKNNNLTILILGPCLSHHNSNEEEELSINNYINNVEIGFVNI